METKENFLIAYLKDAKTELGKVTWPTRQQTTRYSLIVIIACVIVGGFFGIFDFGLVNGFTALVTYLSQN